MILKKIWIMVILIAVSFAGFQGFASSKKTYIARKKSKQEAIMEKQKKARQQRQLNKTMFARNNLDSIQINQILLFSNKTKVVTN